MSAWDACGMVTEANLVGPDDPVALHSDANIGTEWVSGTLHVYIDVSDVDVSVMPIPANGGQWEDIDELNDYVSDLLDETVDLSDPTLQMVIHQTGMVARWNQASETWARQQLIGSLFWSVLTDADGEIRIEDFKMPIRTTQSGCVIATDGDFSGRQCSTILKPDGGICVGTCGAGADDVLDFMPSFASNAQTTLTMFELTTGPELVFDIQAGQLVNEFRRRQVLADEADMRNVYYDVGGSYDTQTADYPSLSYDVDLVNEFHSDKYGVCGFGLAERGIRRIEPETNAGTAPTVSVCEQEL